MKKKKRKQRNIHSENASVITGSDQESSRHADEELHIEIQRRDFIPDPISAHDAASDFEHTIDTKKGLAKLLGTLLGSKYRKDMERLLPVVEQVNALEEKYYSLEDHELTESAITLKMEIRTRIEKIPAEERTKNRINDILNPFLPDAFALVREAAHRVIAERPYNVQVLGAVALHEGSIVEMKTGEGKTLTATMPIFLNALAGLGVHVITVNDYLARRDRNWMGPIYEFLGLSIGVIQHGMSQEGRHLAYDCDITYGTNNEFAWDYLRDNMANSLEEQVQKKRRAYCIIDEVDSVLIDEARTPLIISGIPRQTTDIYKTIDRLARQLKKDEHFELNEEHRSIAILEEGSKEAERILGIHNIYDPNNIELLHFIKQALYAHYLKKRDVDYLVKNNCVTIIDEFTGRLMEGRRWSDGLHQAIEAKEGVPIQQESQTMATISFQNYFKLYTKLSGMTGTAATESAEFKEIYELDVVVIPTHLPMIRRDHPDRIYKTITLKFNALIEEIKEIHATQRPILVGTISVEKSEEISRRLLKEGISHNVLNAKYHDKEATIIREAGKLGMVTIATNMAGRGTDIKLGGDERFDADPETILENRRKVIELGGLHIIGTEKHESRRIDNQLRGRAGRQGDPGSTRFFLSFEDDLIRVFGGDRMKGILEMFNIPDDVYIEMPQVTHMIEKSQIRSEGLNFEIRKNLLEYDDVMNAQRTFIYDLRQNILEGKIEKSYIESMIEESIRGHFAQEAEFIENEKNFQKMDMSHLNREILSDNNTDEIPSIDEIPEPSSPPPTLSVNQNVLNWTRTFFNIEVSDTEIFTAAEEQGHGKNATIDSIPESFLGQFLIDKTMQRYHALEERIGPESMRYLELNYMMQWIGIEWRHHLVNMDHLRDSIGTRAHAQKDPKLEYKFEGFRLFEGMLQKYREEVIGGLLNARFFVEGVGELSQEQVSILMQGGDNNLSTNHQSFNPFQLAGRGVFTAKTPTQQVRRERKKLKPNDPCHCGSGKKYKYCHLKSDLQH